ncbi:MAG: NrfD/PsrC family molybdoenzyme membrane anchor subunit [Deltaproteobacteria bacterium]|nr:NrfD/PsrC family molybdoenzyme membrane anchor subunit [Deltaproteobacteria bacterium]
MHGELPYLFPNDLHIHWSIMIALYPYITGLVAGAFVVSALYHVFDIEEFKPVGRLALLTAFAFLCFATLPLLNHLGHPERGINIMITPNFSSAMAGFGIIYSLYFLLVAVEVWLVYRPDIIEFAKISRGFKRTFYKTLALGVYDLSPQALEHDRKVIHFLAAIGIPGACMLHGYVGFLFGAIKANPWWSTPLMPIIFLFSAVVSGIAMLIIIYQISMKVTGREIDQACMSKLAKFLWGFLIISASLELLEIIMLSYEQAEEWVVISELLTNQLAFSFISLQMIVGALIPFILLMAIVLLDKYVHARVRNTLSFVASVLLLIQVAAMRWNVVIGGQIFSKSFRGFRDYTPHFLEKEGVLPALIIFALPFITLFVLNRILPAFAPAEKAGGE